MKNIIYETAIITGAGAHCPYGFPSGNELKKIIINLLAFYGDPIRDPSLNSDQKRARFLQQISYDVVEVFYQIKNPIEYKKYNSPVRNGNNGHPRFEAHKQEVKNFIHKFAKAQTDSIDLYISRKTATEDDKLIGKILIGVIINHYERKFEIGITERDWIQTIINRYIVPDNGLIFFKNGPAFITFNYDRLFEYSLLHNLISHHDVPADEAIARVGELRIIHVYGSLGEISKDTFGVFTPDDVKNIDVIRNGQTSSEAEILRVLSEVSRIYIFGFAFNQVNLDVLFDRLCKSQWGTTEYKEIMCTSFELSDIEKGKLKKKFEHRKTVSIKFFDGATIDEILSAIVPIET